MDKETCRERIIEISDVELPRVRAQLSRLEAMAELAENFPVMVAGQDIKKDFEEVYEIAILALTEQIRALEAERADLFNQIKKA